MNARQKAKKYKNKIKDLESDNKLMQEIIADSPAMQELYDAYNKSTFVKYTNMYFQQFKAKRMIPVYMTDVDLIIGRTKLAVADDLFEAIKDDITYEIDNNCITASIFVGRK